jgi:hypothetical protein
VALDPFAGTGSALVAALGLGRRALGCELNEAFARFGEQRVRGAAGDEEDAGVVNGRPEPLAAGRPGDGPPAQAVGSSAAP